MSVKAFFALSFMLICVILSAFLVSVIVHEFAHYLMYQKTVFVGFVFDGDIIAKISGQTHFHNQEWIATVAEAVSGLSWLVFGVLSIKKFIDTKFED